MTSKGGAMSVLWMLVTAALVLFVLAFVARSLWRHEDQFRDPRSHERRWESPHLESRDEYELTHDTGSPHLESRSEYEKTHASA
jgi:hypothetical protein